MPPTVVRPWCAHFAESIVRAHNLVCRDEGKLIDRVSVSEEDNEISSPDQWMDRKGELDNLTLFKMYEDMIDGDVLYPTQDPNSTGFFLHMRPGGLDRHDRQDPSTYIPLKISWEIVRRADYQRSIIQLLLRRSLGRQPLRVVENIIAKAISSLAEVGAPSWTVSWDLVDTFWSHHFPAACAMVLDCEPWSTYWTDTSVDVQSTILEGKTQVESEIYYRGLISDNARLSILRAAYYTIMMRAASPIGPGLTEESRIDTALLYMA